MHHLFSCHHAFGIQIAQTFFTRFVFQTFKGSYCRHLSRCKLCSGSPKLSLSCLGMMQNNALSRQRKHNDESLPLMKVSQWYHDVCRHLGLSGWVLHILWRCKQTKLDHFDCLSSISCHLDKNGLVKKIHLYSIFIFCETFQSHSNYLFLSWIFSTYSR